MKKFLSVILFLSLMISASVCSFAINTDVETVNELLSEIAAENNTGVDVKAKSAVLMEKNTGRVLYAVNENERLYPASVTKIMTILLVCEAVDSGKISVDDNVQCSENAASKGGSQIWLKPGEIMTVRELLKATCVYSANDACTLLGEYINGSEQAFIAEMNKKAEELGMKNTHFDNCTGLDDTTDTHLTTAYDIALMSRELLKHEFIKEYTTIWMDSLRKGETELVNTNKLVRFYPGITGLKTGTTSKAGCCISATAERESMELIAVVMGSENSNDRFSSARNLLDWGFSNYETVVPELPGAIPETVTVLHGTEKTVNIIMPEICPVLIKKGDRNKVGVTININDTVDAPIERDDMLGSVTVDYNGETIGTYEIKAEAAVEKLTFFGAFLKLLASFGK